MDYERPQRVSVIDPIGPAIEQARLMLFRPFDLSRWFVIGFCAWLASLGQGGWSAPNFNMGEYNRTPGVQAVKEAVMQNLPWVIAGACFLIPLFIILWLVFCWVGSRGKFMFLHCVAGNKAEVVVPWKKFAGHGNSLFLFRIIFGVISAIVVTLPMVVAVVVFLGMQQAGVAAAAVGGFVLAVLVVIVVAVLVALVAKLTFDFVVPIMSLQAAGCLAAWRTFLALLKANKARILLYVLFQIVISLVISFIVSFICLIGCCLCCSSALLLIPYVGTVILLPLFVFKRAYSLFYLRQFGPQFDVFGSQSS